MAKVNPQMSEPPRSRGKDLPAVPQDEEMVTEYSAYSSTHPGFAEEPSFRPSLERQQMGPKEEVTRRPVPTTKGSNFGRQEASWHPSAPEEQEFARKERETELQGSREIKNEYNYHALWLEATSALNKLQSDRKYTTPDDTLKEMWNQLRYAIKNWAVAHYDRKQKVLNWLSSEGPPHRLKSLVRDYSSYMDEGRLRPLLIQAFIWRRLKEEVFDTDGDRGLLWAGRNHSSFRHLSQVLKPDNNCTAAEIKEYHRWRSLSSALLAGNAPPRDSDPRVGRACNLANEIAPLATSKDSVFQKEFGLGIQKIVNQAIDLDTELHKQRRVFQIWVPIENLMNAPYGYLPDPPGAFERNDGQQLDGNPVELLVVPALIKFGNEDGEHYDQHQVLVAHSIVQASRKDERVQRHAVGRPSVDAPARDRAPSINTQREIVPSAIPNRENVPNEVKTISSRSSERKEKEKKPSIFRRGLDKLSDPTPGQINNLQKKAQQF